MHLKPPKNRRELTDSKASCQRSVVVSYAAILIWILAVFALAAAYPLPKGWTSPLLHAWEALAVVAAGAGILAGWEHSREQPARAVFLLVGVELVIATVGPFAAKNVFAAWPTVAAGVYATGFGLLSLALLWWIRNPEVDECTP